MMGECVALQTSDSPYVLHQVTKKALSLQEHASAILMKIQFHSTTQPPILQVISLIYNAEKKCGPFSYVQYLYACMTCFNVLFHTVSSSAFVSLNAHATLRVRVFFGGGGLISAFLNICCFGVCVEQVNRKGSK